MSGEKAPEHIGKGHGFGTAPVFLASISTILGAILFLRFGYAVGHVGLSGTFLIILLGHLVTIPTALAIAEIATNRRVEGGGEYFIVSRSFGTTIGASIGISLYLSQAVSVAFYMIAFAEAFRPLSESISALTGLPFDPRMISIPALLLLAVLVFFKGANIGVSLLWMVVGILAVSLGMFFLGSPIEGITPDKLDVFGHIDSPEPFIIVFAIVFPAFTGMTAGVGLSGDLADPKRSIPRGILIATLAGLLVYFAAVWKLASSASPEMLATDQLIMSRIALWGPIIPIGLAAACLSSAIGSILVAPRTLQALAVDQIAPSKMVNTFLAHGVGTGNDPRNATFITVLLALGTVAAGNIDLVARIISMFFMVTYGSLCLISFLEHFAARPSYRPAFRSRWYISLLGAVMAFMLMFQMDPVYALVALLFMFGINRWINAVRPQDRDDLSAIFHGVMTQLTRYIQIRLQNIMPWKQSEDWRPSIIMVNGRSFTHTSPIQLFSWLCHRFGFGTYLHYIQGFLSPETYRESRTVMAQLIRLREAKESAIYVDTMISPSMRSALAQSVQVPGITGMENNTILMEFSVHDEADQLEEVREGCEFALSVDMNRLVLRHGDHFFGDRKSIHIWLTWHDYGNVNLMILLAYILIAHPEWEDAEISVFAAFPAEEVEEQTRKLTELIREGRIPITRRNIRIIPTEAQIDFARLSQTTSSDADLVIMGFTQERVDEKGVELFQRFSELKDVLWVAARQEIVIE
ncbi:amino acid permease [Candidatus Zixiibacteriota bacterium]